eukprot:COSAG01_NODE_31219_length_601_cov_1.225100_1_plen_63_part_10
MMRSTVCCAVSWAEPRVPGRLNRVETSLIVAKTTGYVSRYNRYVFVHIAVTAVIRPIFGGLEF